MKKLPIVVVAVLALVALVGGLVSIGARRSRERLALDRARANVVLVSIDTLRADRLSVYGYARRTSPELEKLARESVVFDRFYNCGGGTLPSHLTMMTSLYPATHGIDTGTARRLEEARVTLAEVLQKAGFATDAHIGGGWMSSKFGFDQGFDSFDETAHGFAESLPRAFGWIGQNRDRRFFLFLHSFDVHSAVTRLPYDCPGDAESRFAGAPPAGFTGCRNGACASNLLASLNGRLRGGAKVEEVLSKEEVRYISDLYDGCIHYADEQIGRLVDELKRQGLWNRTLFVVTSDHGEEFGEHGLFLHEQGGYEELSRIPLIVHLPGGELGGRRVTGLAGMVDLMPTLLEEVGLAAPEGIQGKSLVPAMRHGASTRGEVHMYSILRDERYKYFSDEKRLYDLVADPLEKDNRFIREPRLTAGLEVTVRQLIDVDLKSAASFRERYPPNPPVALDSEDRRKLKSLGYLR